MRQFRCEFVLLLMATVGSADEPACEAKCATAGHCCVGATSACQRPSCAMGCLAGAALSLNEAQCNASCTAAAKDTQRWAPPSPSSSSSSSGWALAAGSGSLNLAQCSYAVPGTNITFAMCGNCPAVRAPAWWPAAATPPAGQRPGFWPPGYSLPLCSSCDEVGGDPAGECKLGCMLASRPGLKPTPPAPPAPPAPRGDPPACGVFPSNGDPTQFSPCAGTMTSVAGLNFSSVFSSRAVLQRAPAKAAVYGYLGKLGGGGGGGNKDVDAAALGGGAVVNVTVTVTDAHSDYSYSVAASVDVAAGSWKALLRAAEAGGSHTITASCAGGGCSGSASLADVAFGDVWYCAGQSNMALPLQYSYARNATLREIQQGAYGVAGADIRVTGLKGNMNADQPWITVGDAAMAATVPGSGSGSGSGSGGSRSGSSSSDDLPGYGAIPLDHFSSTCLYFGTSLYLGLQKQQQQQQGGTAGAAPGAAAAVPIGLVHTAWGGSMIEEWLTNDAVAACAGADIADHNALLFDTNVKPYLGMSLKGWVWYQGENNCGGLHGNSGVEASSATAAQPASGYACMMEQLVTLWRERWSATAGTTDPAAPFGVVSLSSHDSEGAADMASFRWAQQGAFGAVPNARMANTFLAHAYDLQDPWNGNTGACTAADAPLKPAAQGGIDCSTPWYMGPSIHPRLKKPVGQRLALGALKTAYGAGGGGAAGGTIKGCSLAGTTPSSAQQQLTLSFELPAGRSLQLRAYNRTGGAVHSATSVQLNGSSWVAADVALGAAPGSVTVTLPPGAAAAGAITAVRYAWGGTDPNGGGDGAGMPNGDDVSCCEGDGVGAPCVPAQCPLLAAEPLAPFGGLPVDPFIAQIVGGKCVCPAPQVCDA